MQCPNCLKSDFNPMYENYHQCVNCGWLVCCMCSGTGTIDTPYSGSDPSCPECSGVGAFNPEVEEDMRTDATMDEVLAAKGVVILSRCNGDMENPYPGEDRISCTGKLLSSGNVIEGCAEPCRWMMQKDGHGVPPFPLEKPSPDLVLLRAATILLKEIKVGEGSKLPGIIAMFEEDIVELETNRNGRS